MAIIVRDDGSVPIPEDLAAEFGIHKGSEVRWERTTDGRLALRPSMTREEAARKLSGMLKGYLKPGESAVADLVREREADMIREEVLPQKS